MARARYTRWVAAADNHGNHQDDSAVAAFHDFCKWFGPAERLHIGDAFDFACLRRGASDEEKREPLKADIEAGIDFLATFKPTVYLRGNHCQRLYDAVESDDGKLADFAGYLAGDIEKALKGVRVYPYCKRRGVHRMGGLSFIHGYHAGLTAARMAAQAYGHVCMGHVHCSDQARAARIDGAVGHSSGALCKLDARYNRGHANTLRQSVGWLYGVTHPNGCFQVWHADRLEDGTWFLPSEWREANGAGKN